MRKLTTFQPELVIRCFPEQWWLYPAEINKGKCMQWAYYAYCLFDGVRLWSYGSHAFIKHGTRYYDSERLAGERDWRDLPACNFGKGCGRHLCTLCSKRARPMNVNRFQETWGGYDLPWHRYYQTANQWLERNSNETLASNNVGE